MRPGPWWGVSSIHRCNGAVQHPIRNLALKAICRSSHHKSRLRVRCPKAEVYIPSSSELYASADAQRHLVGALVEHATRRSAFWKSCLFTIICTVIGGDHQLYIREACVDQSADEFGSAMHYEEVVAVVGYFSSSSLIGWGTF